MTHFFNNAQSIGFTLPSLVSEKKYFPHSNCLVLNGKEVSKEIINQCKEKFANSTFSPPHLVVVLVGENKASEVYVQNKIKVFANANFKTTLFRVSNQDANEENILRHIETFNKDTNVHGILVQLPLPSHLNSEKILKAVAVEKDVDGFSAQNIGLLALNNASAISACTPFGIMILLASYGISITGKHCVVVGRSAIVGKPMGLLLLNANATVTFVHSHTVDINFYTKDADILIVAAGKKHLINKEHIKEGAVVIDVGIHKNSDGTLSGDVHEDVCTKASAITPVPGGVGPMTIAALLLNTSIQRLTEYF